MTRDVIKDILKFCPPYIKCQGVTFEFTLFINGTNDIRLCYRISDIDKRSKHVTQWLHYGSWSNPFDGGKHQSFLFLIENITSMVDLKQAVMQWNIFRLKNKLK
jgi:hypothetical protein